MSSGEGMAQMLRVLPNTVFVGKPTRGASGNPRPLPLPNGVDVWHSRWWNLLADGTPLEGRGVVPDVAVDDEGDGDPTLAAALAALRERSGK
jgi:C-terminal processing protease CtpA/Prc